MKDNNYIAIQGWMINKLKLSGNELIVYAAIYGFSQDGASKFEGSYQWLADAAGISKRAIITILGKLTERGLLQKTKSSKNGSKYFDYKAAIDCFAKETGEESSPMIGEESSPEKPQSVKSIHRIGEESSPMIGEESSPEKPQSVKSIHRIGEESSPMIGEESSPHITSINNLGIESGNSGELPGPVKESMKDALDLSLLLLSSHRQEFPDFLSGKDDKKTASRWAEDIEKLIRIDKKAPETIRSVILWVKKPGNFWFLNIESGKKLREKFERLYGEFKSGRYRPPPDDGLPNIAESGVQLLSEVEI